MVSHELAGRSAALPLIHFDMLLVVAPDRRGAWGRGESPQQDANTVGDGSGRDDGVSGGSDGGVVATAADMFFCRSWAAVPQRLREVDVERWERWERAEDRSSRGGYPSHGGLFQ